MTEHPSQFTLEAYFVGEVDAETSTHIEQCTHCQRRLAELNILRSNDLEAEPAAAFFERPMIQAAFEEQATSQGRSRKSIWSAWLVASGILAAAIMAYVAVIPGVTVETVSDQIVMKGEQVELMVLRSRGAHQTQHQGHVVVQAGDRLRIRVRVGQPTRLSAGVLTEDQSWIALATDTAYAAGEHFIHDDALVVDGPSSGGTIFVGRPELVSQARRNGRYHRLTKLDIRPRP